MMFEQCFDCETSQRKCNINAFKNITIEHIISVLQTNPFYMSGSDADNTENIIRQTIKLFNERVKELYLLINPSHAAKRIMKLQSDNYREFMAWFMEEIHDRWDSFIK